MVIVNQDRGMPDTGLWLYALTQHSMTNRYAALNENMIYHCPHDVVPLYEKRLYSAFQFMHQLLHQLPIRRQRLLPKPSATTSTTTVVLDQQPCSNLPAA